MSGSEGSAGREVGDGRIPCPRCGHLNYPTDAVCLNCGADLDQSRSQGVSPPHDEVVSESTPLDRAPAAATGRDWRGPALFLLWAGFFCLLNLLVRVTGARPCPLQMIELSLGLEVVAGIVAVYEAVRVSRGESGWPLGPCQSTSAWVAVLIVSLGLAGVGLGLAFSETRDVNQLAATGRTDFCPVRIPSRRWVWSKGGGHYLYTVDFTVGGQSFEDEVGLSMMPPALGWASMGQTERVPVAWLPQHPEINRLGGMSPAVPLTLNLLWGLDMLYLLAGLGLICWYTAPLQGVDA